MRAAGLSTTLVAVGLAYEGDTLNTIWPEQKALPKQFWWGTEAR